MSDERPFHERDLYRRYVDRGIAIEAALTWLKANDVIASHDGECDIVTWWNIPDDDKDKPNCTCAFGRLVKQLERLS